jgi:hypothetical protein
LMMMMLGDVVVVVTLAWCFDIHSVVTCSWWLFCSVVWFEISGTFYSVGIDVIPFDDAFIVFIVAFVLPCTCIHCFICSLFIDILLTFDDACSFYSFYWVVVFYHVHFHLCWCVVTNGRTCRWPFGTDVWWLTLWWYSVEMKFYWWYDWPVYSFIDLHWLTVLCIQVFDLFWLVTLRLIYSAVTICDLVLITVVWWQYIALIWCLHWCSDSLEYILMLFNYWPLLYDWWCYLLFCYVDCIDDMTFSDSCSMTVFVICLFEGYWLFYRITIAVLMMTWSDIDLFNIMILLLFCINSIIYSFRERYIVIILTSEKLYW